MGQEEETKMELELDAAHALANLAGSDPISNQSSISQEEEPHQIQEKVGQNLKEVKGNSCQNQTLDNMGPSNSINQGEVSSLRGQKNLNEAERHAKRQRRILANRESARQTILRRQAFRDELARKVSTLSAENLILKKEKENATREYFYQKEMNQQLKDQVGHTTSNDADNSFERRKDTPSTTLCTRTSNARDSEHTSRSIMLTNTGYWDGERRDSRAEA
ncbi:uncharacterized protein LOC144564936 isoform X3 [Carex rostrata]